MRVSGWTSTGPNCAKSTAGTRGRCRGRRRCRGCGRRRQRALDEGLDVVVRDAALEAVPGHARQVDAELAREAPHRGTRVGAREARLVDRARRSARARGHGEPAALAARSGRGRSGAAPARRRVRTPAASRRRRRRAARRAALRGRLRPRPADGRVASSTRRRPASPADTLPPLATCTFVDHAGRGRRHVHGRLLGLERDERRVDRDRVARLHQHVDDGDVLEVAQVGHAHFDELPRSCARAPQTVQGIGLVRIDAEPCIACAHGRLVDLALVGQRLERRDHDVVAIDLEVPAQRGARVAAAEAVGARASRSGPAPTGGSGPAPCACSRSRRSTGPCAVLEQLAARTARAAPRPDAAGSSARTRSASRRSSLKLVTREHVRRHAVVLLQDLRRREHLAQDRAGAEQRRAHLAAAAHLQQVARP